MHEHFIRRCFELAARGAGNVSPNPLVGAVLVHEGRIIGEGWHAQYGAAHAEVNAVAAVAAADRRLIAASTLYCNLEPCFHFGKTPPCVDLVLREGIRQVVISNVDPNPQVGGQSLRKLRGAGVEVLSGVLEHEGALLNRMFFTSIREKRPYVVLKWAQSADGFLGRQGERTPVTGPPAQRLVHRWRSESDAILVGTNTAVTDNPRLDNRLYPGPSPLRLAFDLSEKIPSTHHLLDDSRPTWILGPARAGAWTQTRFLDIHGAESIPVLLSYLFENQKNIVFVEGGARLHRAFLDAGLADEIRVLKNKKRLGSGIEAPLVPDAYSVWEQYELGEDRVEILLRSTLLI